MNETQYTLIKSIIFFGILISTVSCASVPKFSRVGTPEQEVNYSNLRNWAAHPDKEDAADIVPVAIAEKNIKIPEVDIFFVHPTTYTQKVINDSWNGDINDQKLNESTDDGSIKMQASIFNQVGRVYAPRYRQAHIHAFFTEEKELGQKALAFAYEDIKKAFEYYLTNENNGRPIIIASHSQGTIHAGRLMKDYFDGQDLQKQLVTAYLIGMPVKEDTFDNITACESESETGCFISWRTFREGFTPEDRPLGDEIVVTNPLNWNRSKQLIGKVSHKGAILRNFDKPLINLLEARISNGVLLTNKPKFPFSFLWNRKDYHIADMNFFYVDIQENAHYRAMEYLKKS